MVAASNSETLNVPASRSQRPPVSSKLKWGIHHAVQAAHHATSNRQITIMHYRLGGQLREAIGGGPNFHDWAVWGSHKAGATIRGEDQFQLLVRYRSLLVLAMLAVSTTIAWACSMSPVVGITALIGQLLSLRFLFMRSTKMSAAAILAGNREVLEDIGSQTAGFLDVLSHPRGKARHRAFHYFIAAMSTKEQPLLRRAFGEYFLASENNDPSQKRRHVVAGNCFAVAHEHLRLQNYIELAMPRVLRRTITNNCMSYQAGEGRLDVSKDFIDIAPLTREHRRAAQQVAGEVSHLIQVPKRGIPSATDWTQFGQRMSHVFALFQNFHNQVDVLPKLCVSRSGDSYRIVTDGVEPRRRLTPNVRKLSLTPVIIRTAGRPSSRIAPLRTETGTRKV